MSARSIDTRLWRTLAGLVLAFAVAGSLAFGILWATIPVRPVRINIRWKPAVADAERAALESQFRLIDPQFREGTTWGYFLADPSRSMIRSIVQHPAVDDTDHVDRRSFRPELAGDRTRRIQRNAALCGAIGSVLWLLLPSALFVLRTPVTLSRKSLTALVSVPPAIFVLASFAILLMAASGSAPLVRTSSTPTLPEAALIADQATVERLVGGGADPNAAGPASFNGRRSEGTLTPLEAGIKSGDPEVVQLLIKLGARVDDGNRTRLYCLATTLHAEEMAALVLKAGGPGGTPFCN